MNSTSNTLQKYAVSFAVSIALLTTTANAFAEEASKQSADKHIEKITVTSDFRQQSLLTSPTSLSVLTDVEVQQRNAKHLEELIAIAPNVNFASGSQRARYYQIRGIGERSQFQEPINPSVGLVIDGIDFTGVGSIANLFDVNQVEIFRGPQSSLLGANAIAGMINITTKAPTDDFEGAVKIDAGNYDSYGLGLALSGPATDSVNYRVAANKYTSDGFMENTYLGRDDTNNRDELSLRGKLSIEASEDLIIDLAAFHFDFNNGYDAFSLNNTHETLSDEPGKDAQKTSAFSAKFSYQGFKNFDLTALVSHADTDLTYGYDEDWAYVGISDPSVNPDIDPNFAYWEYTSTDYYFREKSVQTIELRATSNEGSEIFNNTTSWVAGVYFKQDEEDLLREYTYASSDFMSTVDNTNIAAYGQLDTQLSDKLALATGIRVEQRGSKYNNSNNYADSPSDTMVGGKVVLSYQQNNDSLWYGSINRGYKAGGNNTDGSLPAELRSFDPEYLWNYEVGYKVSLLNNDAYIRTAVFYMDRTDVQVKSSKTIERPDGSSEFIAYLGNAASGTNAGIEVESAWQVSSDVEVYGSLGLLNTKFDDFINAEGESLSGREQAHAPKYQYNVGVNYQPSEYWLMNISVDGKDAFYFSDSHDEQSESVALLNASVAYLGDDYEIKLWGRNLTDKDYANRGFNFGNDPRDGYTAKQYTQLSEPMVFGVTLDYQF
ncbi:MAG: TonB-dependent receptor [Colwellia sp.]